MKIQNYAPVKVKMIILGISNFTLIKNTKKYKWKYKIEVKVKMTVLVKYIFSQIKKQYKNN